MFVSECLFRRVFIKNYNVIFLIIKMKAGHQAKPKLQIIKNFTKHNYRTQ